MLKLNGEVILCLFYSCGGLGGILTEIKHQFWKSRYDQILLKKKDLN